MRCAPPAGRPAKAWAVPGVEPPEPTRLGEVAWLEPFLTPFSRERSDVPLGPEARYEQTESISLAFVTALAVLPPRQLAVLILARRSRVRASEAGRDARFDSRIGEQLTQARPQRFAAKAPDDGRESPAPTQSRRGDRGEVSCGPTKPRICLRWLSFSPTTSSCRCRPVPLEYEGRDVRRPVRRLLFDAGRRFSLVPPEQMPSRRRCLCPRTGWDAPSERLIAVSLWAAVRRPEAFSKPAYFLVRAADVAARVAPRAIQLRGDQFDVVAGRRDESCQV